MSVLRLCVLVAIAPAIARAESVSEQAKRLFDEGAQLRKQGELERACNRFAKSFALVAAPGTAYDLAECMERDRKFLRARDLYRDAGNAWERAGKLELAATARERAEAIADKLGQLVVDIAEPALDQLVVTIGDHRVDPDAELREQVDPGIVDVTAAAPGHRPFATSARVAAGATVTIEVPALASIDRAEPPPPPAPPEAGHERRRSSSRLYVSIGLGVAAGAGLVAGGVLFFDARDAYQQAGMDLQKEASARATADVATGIGIAGVACAIASALVFTGTF